MSKKDRNHKMSFECPKCRGRNETRNMFPKCFHCGEPLVVERTNPCIVVRLRRLKKK